MKKILCISVKIVFCNFSINIAPLLGLSLEFCPPSVTECDNPVLEDSNVFPEHL